MSKTLPLKSWRGSRTVLDATIEVYTIQSALATDTSLGAAGQRCLPPVLREQKQQQCQDQRVQHPACVRKTRRHKSRAVPKDVVVVDDPSEPVEESPTRPGLAFRVIGE